MKSVLKIPGIHVFYNLTAAAVFPTLCTVHTQKLVIPPPLPPPPFNNFTTRSYLRMSGMGKT
jgi:hypothetical protein